MLKIAWAACYNHPLDNRHRFPMVKYDLVPGKLIDEGTIRSDQLFTPGPVAEALILTTHHPDYWAKLKTGKLSPNEIRRTGFPYSPELIDRERTIMQGTVDAALWALENQVGFNVSGGTHHAFTDKGEGFCLLNDIGIAANHLRHQGLVNKILVVDLDVHQGNGTAEIFRQDPRVFTFSMHGAKNFPMEKAESDLDVALPDHMEDRAYLDLLDYHLNSLLETVEPDFIFYQAGVDILASDQLGRLDLSREGCKARDEMVLKACKKNSIPLAVSMGGGYSRQIEDIVEAHANTFRLAQEVFF